MTHATFTSYHELKKKNNNRRIWLEGEPLLRAGFQPGDFFETHLNLDTLTVTLHHVEDSAEARALHKKRLLNKVSRRDMGGYLKPIVDICNAEITQLFGEFARFRAQAFAGRIEFSIHPEEKARAEREQRFLRHLAQGTISKGDAFLGMGLSSSAFKQGFANEGIATEQKWAIEMEAKYLDVAARNDADSYRNAHLFCGTVEEVEKDLLEPVDAFGFSMACTNHSLAGRAKKHLTSAEMGDEVTSLFGVVSLIQAVNPAILISENVPAAKDSVSYGLLRKELTRLGYEYHETIMDNRHTGALENRRRYWLVAYSKGLNVNTESLTPSVAEPQHDNFGAVMEQDESLHRWFPLSTLDKRQRKNTEAGRNFSMNLIDADSTSLSTIPRNYAKHQLSNPHVVNKSGTHYRLLSLAEHAAVKDVPLHLVNGVSATLGHEGLGQAIDYRQAVYTAQGLLRSISSDPSQPRLAL